MPRPRSDPSGRRLGKARAVGGWVLSGCLAGALRRHEGEGQLGVSRAEERAVLTLAQLRMRTFCANGCTSTLHARIPHPGNLYFIVRLGHHQPSQLIDIVELMSPLRALCLVVIELINESARLQDRRLTCKNQSRCYTPAVNNATSRKQVHLRYKKCVCINLAKEISDWYSDYDKH